MWHDRVRSDQVQEHVTAHGKRIAVEVLNPKRPARKRRKSFEARWVQLSHYWIERLEKAHSIYTFKLANRILCEAFKRKRVGGDIILSAVVTGLPRQRRAEAIRELVKLRLIEVTKCGNQAVRVARLLGMPRNAASA